MFIQCHNPEDNYLKFRCRADLDSDIHRLLQNDRRGRDKNLLMVLVSGNYVTGQQCPLYWYQGTV
jgi:hypothetical protein